MTTTEHRRVVQRLVEEVLNGGDLDRIDDFYAPELAPAARRWIGPFRESFPDVHMEVVATVAEDDQVVARFLCTGTHLGSWRGHPPTGRRFRVDEVYWFTFEDGRISRAWGIEDTLRRLKQLGLPAGS